MKRLIIILLMVVAAESSQAQEMTAADSAIIWHTQKFRTMLETAVKNYKDSVDIKRISEAGYEAMLEALDPYSNYMTKEVYQNFKDNYSKTIRMIGITPISINDTLFVLFITPDSPADSAGIIPGDKILYLNGQNAVKMESKKANKLFTVSDSSISSVNIVIKRGYGASLNEYILTPKAMPIESITTYFILPGTDIGYIKSKRFAKTADSMFRKTLNLLREQGAKSILFDIRGHQGGQVDQAAEIVDEFIVEDKVITYIEGKNNGYYQKYISEAGNIAEDMPLVVLIDGNTMSAAEIFAGAIQDLDRGILVGDISYGKGMAQKSWSFRDGSAFRLTIGNYYSPSGRNIQKPHEDKKIELDPAIKLKLGEKGSEDIEKIVNKFGGKSQLPTYNTARGRVVLGGGGIYPDDFALPDTTTLLTRVLKQKNIIIEAVFVYLETNRDAIKKEYAGDIEKFNHDFKVNDEMLKQMESVSRNKNIWNEQMFREDKEYLKNYYKSLVAYFIWGNKGFYLVEANEDAVLKRGIENMPEAIIFLEQIKGIK